ncbi:MBL fold metallo-hydrolase [Oleiagrimonas sp.]|jgi:cyclase|uniref:MBL fold metallo-hydrolase n=1 Tax=Oleiagrimonas sp. TaxID=2010330 RepID=UPI002635CA22|nr:MBL fold metallo-hydrolase [Oleiagrimonas sp.]MDA3914020.1 MBL fold metallo-hydrolase [Oleiagrimonas sp.]
MLRPITRNLVLMLGLLAGSGGVRAATTHAYFTLHHLGKGIWAAIDKPGSHAGSNSGFIIGDKAVLVVDSFEDPAAAKALLKVIHSKTHLPVRYLVNTHYHLDHVAGNGVYRKAGAVILAQRNVRTWERTENLKFFGSKITPAQKKMVQSFVLPEVVYRHGIELYLGHRKVVVRVLPGHTGGDSIVVVPDANVVFTGDLFWNHTLPNLIDANTAAQIHTNTVFLHDYPSATFVPGHGEVGHAANVRAFRGYLENLRQTIKNAQGKGEQGKKLVQDVLRQIKARYGEWNYFGYFASKNITQTVAELAGKKHLPEASP